MTTPTAPTTDMPGRPPYPHPSIGRSRPSSARYWIGGALIGVALVGAVLWIAIGWFALMHHVDGFPRMAVPGTATIHVNADTKRVFYTEHARGVGDITASDIAVVSPTGQPMPVGAYSYDLRYDVPGDTSRVGRAVASFRSTVAGDYTVTVTGAAPGSTVAIGDDVVWDAVPHVIGAGALLLVGVGAGVALIGVTAVQRGRVR